MRLVIVLVVIVFCLFGCEKTSREEIASAELTFQLLKLENVLKSEGNDIAVVAHFQLPEGWHIYWKEPGETGLATNFNIKHANGSGGIQRMEFSYPTPELFIQEDIWSYGYKDAVTFMAPLAGGTSIDSTVTLKGTVEWLLCSESLCIPEERIVNEKLSVVEHLGQQTSYAFPVPYASHQGQLCLEVSTLDNISIILNAKGLCAVEQLFFYSSPRIVHERPKSEDHLTYVRFASQSFPSSARAKEFFVHNPWELVVLCEKGSNSQQSYLLSNVMAGISECLTEGSQESLK